jgi:hypothetical protein
LHFRLFVGGLSDGDGDGFASLRSRRQNYGGSSPAIYLAKHFGRFAAALFLSLSLRGAPPAQNLSLGELLVLVGGEFSFFL